MPARRECLPSKEREDFIKMVKTKGITAIAVGCKNRYIDEFLRYCDRQSGTTAIKTIKPQMIHDFANHLLGSSVQKNTVRAKLGAVLEWCRWLDESGHPINAEIVKLQASELLP